MRSNESIEPYQRIDNPLDLAQLALAERPTLKDLLNEHINEDFEIEFFPKEITMQMPSNGFTTIIKGKRYVIVQFGEYEAYVNEELAKELYVLYPIFANYDYYTGYVFDNEDEAIEFVTGFCKIWKGVDSYLMMRELNKMSD
jgi:hypothetical protein